MRIHREKHNEKRKLLHRLFRSGKLSHRSSMSSSLLFLKILSDHGRLFFLGKSWSHRGVSSFLGTTCVCKFSISFTCAHSASSEQLRQTASMTPYIQSTVYLRSPIQGLDDVYKQICVRNSWLCATVWMEAKIRFRTPEVVSELRCCNETHRCFYFIALYISY